MCLSSVYADRVDTENLILSNVQRIDCREGYVILTDILEQEMKVPGCLLSIDLVGNTAIIERTERQS